MLMPSRLGMAIRRRLITYCPIATTSLAGLRAVDAAPVPRLRLAVPVRERPEVVVPAAERGAQLVGRSRNARPIDHGNDHVVAAGQIVHADERGRALDRIELGLGRAERLV